MKSFTCEEEEFTKIRLLPVNLQNLNLEKPRMRQMPLTIIFYNVYFK